MLALFEPKTFRLTMAMRVALAGVCSAAVLSACGGTADGGEGDLPSEPRADRYGDGARLVEVLGPATWFNAENTESVDCEIPNDRPIQVTGQTIIAIDKFDETGTGSLGNIYVQDSNLNPVAYSGITVFDPSFTPPDLRLTPGDVVDTLGAMQEFPGPNSATFGLCKTLPEIGGTMAFRYENGPRVPLTVVAAGGGPGRWTPLTNYQDARQYLGMLVRVEDVTIDGDPYASNGRYTADIAVGGGVPFEDVPEISNELFDLERDGPPVSDGAHFTAVTGVLTYFFSFRIAPRSADDFEL